MGAPTIQLLGGSGSVLLRQGAPYQACTPGQQPTDHTPCEPGVSAYDSVGTSLSYNVLACAPPSCAAAAACPAYAFAQGGISGCGVNSSAPVGTLYTLVFSVHSADSRVAAASVSRRVLVVDRCDLPFNNCGDVCVEVPCATLAIVEAIHGPVTPRPPLFTFGFAQSSPAAAASPSAGISVTAGRRRRRQLVLDDLQPPTAEHQPPTTNHQLPTTEHQAPEGGAAAGHLDGPHHRQLMQAAEGDDWGGLQQYISYGLAPGLSLAPCKQGYTSCSVTARDYMHNDLSADIDVEDVTPGCSSSGQDDYGLGYGSTPCSYCSPMLLEAKLCLPGNYTFRYTVVDGAGRNPKPYTLHPTP